MDRLIKKLQNGHKLCTAGISVDCMKLSKKEDFVGNICVKCSNMKKRIYHQNYNKKMKQHVKSVYSGLKYTTKDEDDLNRDLGLSSDESDLDNDYLYDASNEEQEEGIFEMDPEENEQEEEQ